jgi:hypothetical protein
VPSAVIAIPAGVSPTVIGAPAVLVARSIGVTLSDELSVTYAIRFAAAVAGAVSAIIIPAPRTRSAHLRAPRCAAVLLNLHRACATMISGRSIQSPTWSWRATYSFQWPARPGPRSRTTSRPIRIADDRAADLASPACRARLKTIGAKPHDPGRGARSLNDPECASGETLLAPTRASATRDLRVILTDIARLLSTAPVVGAPCILRRPVRQFGAEQAARPGQDRIECRSQAGFPAAWGRRTSVEKAR